MDVFKNDYVLGQIWFRCFSEFLVEINVTIGFQVKFYMRQCSYLKFPKFQLWAVFILVPQLLITRFEILFIFSCNKLYLNYDITCAQNSLYMLSHASFE